MLGDDAAKTSDPLDLEDLDVTWWVLDREPGMDDMAAQAGNSLQRMKDDLKIYPFRDLDENDRLFLARYEFPKYGADFTYTSAVFASGTVGGFIDFLAGFPIDCVEMLLAIGIYSTQPSEAISAAVKPGVGVVPPIPAQFFTWPDTDKVMLNYTAVATQNIGKIFAANLPGEDRPTNAHWWFRVNLVDQAAKKWPVPGEFLGLAVRMMPDMTWGKQLSSPFLWSGNFADTVYYTSGFVTEVIPPETEDEAVAGKFPWNTYKVAWRVCEDSDSEGVIQMVIPSDFAEYRDGDFVAILKDTETEKKTQLWRDPDMTAWGTNWQIAPINFYGIGLPEEA